VATFKREDSIMIDIKKVKKSLGSKLTSQVSFKEEAHQVTLTMKGALWVNEILENEIAFIGELLKANKKVRVVFSANLKLGTYSIQMLCKLRDQLESSGNMMTIEGMKKDHVKLINILGAELAA
jgi:hypothetical protein